MELAHAIPERAVFLSRTLPVSRAVCDILGGARIERLSLPDNRLDNVPALHVVQAIEPIISDTTPSVVLAHYTYDLKVDHRICHQAVIGAYRPQRGHLVKTIINFEVASTPEWAFSSEGFEPNYFIDISSSLDIKLSALDAYSEEMRSAPHPRSPSGIEALARWRGATVGYRAAEAFSVVRMIIDEV